MISFREYQKISFPDVIKGFRLFGSYARGDFDDASDLDFLVVLNGDHNGISESVFSSIKRIAKKEPSISWYSERRIKEIFRDGHLFAWHLYLESMPLLRNMESDIVTKLGKPNEYLGALEDIKSLIEILLSVKNAIKRCPRNLVYEAGIIYICVKNIALSATSVFSERLDFSRYSPYNQGINRFVNFPLPELKYELLIQSRHASMRGLPLPNIEHYELSKTCDYIIDWAGKIENNMRLRKNGYSENSAKI